MRTMAYALPTVLELLFQLSPLFLGYACFGMVVWGGHCARFAGLWESCLTLYAVVNGDIIQDTFLALERSGAAPAWVAQLYVYSYIMLFMCVGLVSIRLLLCVGFLFFFCLASSPHHPPHANAQVRRPQHDADSRGESIPRAAPGV
jgi:hypothetical protein